MRLLLALVAFVFVLGDGDCLSRLTAQCGSATDSSVKDCEACVGIHVEQIQPCTDVNVGNFCDPPPPKPTFTVQAQFQFVLKSGTGSISAPERLAIEQSVSLLVFV